MTDRVAQWLDERMRISAVVRAWRSQVCSRITGRYCLMIYPFIEGWTPAIDANTTC